MRSGRGLQVASSAPPPPSAVETSGADGCHQMQQDKTILFGENDEVEEDSDPKLLESKQTYEKCVRSPSGFNVEGMMPPSEETNTASTAVQNTCSNPNISSAQCGVSSTPGLEVSNVKLSSSVVDSAAVKDLLTATLCSVNTKSVLLGTVDKSKTVRNFAENKGDTARHVSENKLWNPPTDFKCFENVKSKVQHIRSFKYSNDDLNTYTDISSVSSGGLSSDEESEDIQDDNFEQFVVNDVGAINLVKGECSTASCSEGASHHRPGWAKNKKTAEIPFLADQNVQSAPLCLTVNKRPETLVESPPVKNLGPGLQQPSTFRHVSNPVCLPAFAPKYRARWPLLQIPFHSSGFRGSGIVGSDDVHSRNSQFRPPAQRRHSWDDKLPYFPDSDLTSSDSESSADDTLQFLNIVGSPQTKNPQVKHQDLVSKLRCNVQGIPLPSSSLKIASQDASVLSQLCSVSASAVKSEVYHDGNAIPKSANALKCSETSSSEQVDNATHFAGSKVQNAGCCDVQSSGNSRSCNKLLSTEHCNGIFKPSSAVPPQKEKKNKLKRLTVAKVSSVRCSRKKSNEVDNIHYCTPLLKSTCSKVSVINGCYSLCSAKEGQYEETDDTLGQIINNKVNYNNENVHCVLAVGGGTCKTATDNSTLNEVTSSQVCDSTSCSSQDLREEALKVVTHCLKDLIFRVVTFPNQSTVTTGMTSVLPLSESEIQSSSVKCVEKETDIVKVNDTLCMSNEEQCNTDFDEIGGKIKKCSENYVSSTCVETSLQSSDKSTKSVQVEIRDEGETNILGGILEAALIPNIIRTTKCFLNHECEMSTHGLGLTNSGRLLPYDVDSQKHLCLGSSQICTSLTVPDSSNNSNCVLIDKSCEISLSDLDPCHKKFSFDDIALARNVEEKCLMIQQSLSRKKLGSDDAIYRKGDNCFLSRTLSVTGVTCSLPLTKVSLALAGCALASDAACVSTPKQLDVLPNDCYGASIDSHGSEDWAREGLNPLSNMKCNDALLLVRPVNSSVTSSAQTDVSYQNSFPSSTDVPSKFLFQVQPVHHMKLGDGQKLYACDICSSVYQRSFSLKRHYLRSHINYRHLTERDISNCGIIVGDKMAVQTGTNTKIYMQNSKITSQQLGTVHHEISINKNDLTNYTSDCVKSNTISRSEQNETDLTSSEKSRNNNTVPTLPIELSIKEDKEKKAIHFPALYRCHFCGICFDVKEHLKSHLLNHPPPVTGVSKDSNSFVCDTCSLVFTHKHNYLRHCASENHKNASKPQSQCITEHLCLYCDKKFKTSAIRKRHQNRIHQYFSKQKKPGKRPFHPCSYCPSTAHKFKDLTVLVKHMIASHPDKYHVCLECSERFHCENAFNSHLISVHGKNKSKVLKGAEIKENKSSSEPIKIAVDKEENSSSNISFPVAKISSDENNKTSTKKSPDKKLSETVKELTLNEDTFNGISKPLNGSSINDEFRYTCGVCQKMFTNYVNMCRHRRLAHGTITANSKKVKKGLASSEPSGTRSTSSQSGDSRSESPALASKAPVELSNKEQGAALVVQPLDPETLFYSKIAINIRENLLNHLDGKLLECNNTSTTTTTLATRTTTVTTATKESKVVYERSIATDRPKRGEKSILKVDGKSPNTHVNSANVNERNQNIDNEKSKLGGRRGHIHKVPWEKYNFPKNYDGKGDGLASFIKDLSHLDISTQLVMQQNLQRVSFSSGDKCKCSLPDTPVSEESAQDSDFPKGLCLMQRNTSNALSDMFSTSRHESTLTRACSSSSVPSLINIKYTCANDGHSNLTRRKSLSDIKMPSPADESSDRSDGGDKGENVELSGEWVRPRSYICGACSERFGDLYDLEDHKFVAHPNVWCTHFEFEESTITGMSFDRSRCHASFPGNLSRRYLNTAGTLHVPELAPPTTSVESQCTKCSKNFSSLPELHRHILDCGGDTTWMLTMVAATSSGSRRNRKWRPFGSRRRRQQGRRGMKRNIPSSPMKLPQYRVRHRGTDSDSIQRMIANLPAKRASRRVIQFNEDEIKTRSQATVHCVSNYVSNMHHHKSWSGHSSTTRGITFSQYHKMSSTETRHSRALQNIRRASSESTASKLLRSSRNFLQNKTSPKAVKDVTKALPGNQSQMTSVTDQKTNFLEKEDVLDNCAPVTRNMLAKKMRGNKVLSLSSEGKASRSSRFVRKSVISNIKSKYRTAPRKILVPVPCHSKDQKQLVSQVALPRRSGRTSVLREKINDNVIVPSVAVDASIIEDSALNSSKPSSQSLTEGNLDCRKTIPSEKLENQNSTNNTLKSENFKPEKRKKGQIKSPGNGNKTKTKMLKVSNNKYDISEKDEKKISCKDCRVVCDNLCLPCKNNNSEIQDKMANGAHESQTIPTPRMCLSCGRKFKAISALEKHLQKCGVAVNKSVEENKLKSQRRSMRKLQISMCKTDGSKAKEIDENMPQLQKEEPLEVLPVAESVKKCEDITNDIPVLSPVLEDATIHTVNVCYNEENCVSAKTEELRSKRKSKRGQKVEPSNDKILNKEKNECCGQDSNAVELANIISTKNAIQGSKIKVTRALASAEDQTVSSSNGKNLKKVLSKKKNHANKIVVAVAKEKENLNVDIAVSSNLLQVVLDTSKDAESVNTSVLELNPDNKIDLSLTQKSLKANTNRKDHPGKKKNVIGKNKSIYKVGNKNTKKAKEKTVEKRHISVENQDYIAYTEIVSDGVKNHIKNTKGNQMTKKVGRPMKVKKQVVKSNNEKKCNKLRSSKRLSKIVSNKIVAESISSEHSKTFLEKDKGELGNVCNEVQAQDMPRDKTVLCCKESDCKCSNIDVSPELSLDVVEKGLGTIEIQLPSKSPGIECVIKNCEDADKTCTEATISFPEKFDSPLHGLPDIDNAKEKEIVLKDVMEMEDCSSVKNGEFSLETSVSSGHSYFVPDVLNELNNDVSSWKESDQSGLKKSLQCISNKKNDKIPNSIKYKTKTLKLLTTVNKKKFSLDNSECKNNYKSYQLEKFECSEETNANDKKIDLKDVSDTISLLKPVVKNPVEIENDRKEALLSISCLGKKETWKKNKLTAPEEFGTTEVTKESCVFLPHEIVQSTDETQVNLEIKLDQESKGDKQNYSSVNRIGRRKFKFPKIKSGAFSECNLNSKRRCRRRNYLFQKCDEGNVTLNTFLSDFVRSNKEASCSVPENVNASAKSEILPETTQPESVSTIAVCVLETHVENSETDHDTISEAIFSDSNKLDCNIVQDVKEICSSENLIETSGTDLVLNCIIDSSNDDESACSIIKEHKQNETILNTRNNEGKTLPAEVSTLSESSLDIDEDMLPIAKLREINLSRVRNLNRLSRNNRKQVKKTRKCRMKAAETKHLKIQTIGMSPNAKNSPPRNGHNLELGDCFVRKPEETKLQNDITLSNDGFITEGNLSLAGNRLLRTRRSNSSDKSFLSHFERRESRARSTRWNLSYEEMYTSSDIASEADSQEFDSNQKENKGVLQEHHRRKRSRRMKTAKPSYNFIRQDKKRRRSLRRLTVLRNQRKAEMRLETKAYICGEMSVPVSLGSDNVEGDMTNVKVTLTGNMFEYENFHHDSSENNYSSIIVESATEEEMLSEITKTAVINKVFCKKPKKNHLCESTKKEKNSVMDISDKESFIDDVPVVFMDALEKLTEFTCNEPSGENILSIDNQCSTITMKYDNVKENNSSEIFDTDLIVNEELGNNGVEAETSNSTQVIKQVCKILKTSNESQVCSSKNQNTQSKENFFVKKREAKNNNFETTRKRKKMKRKCSTKGNMSTLDQESDIIPEPLIATDDINVGKIQQIENMLHHKNVEDSVELCEATQTSETPETKTVEKHNFDVSDTHLILDKILEFADTASENDAPILQEEVMGAYSEEESALYKNKSYLNTSLDNLETVPNEADGKVASLYTFNQQQLNCCSLRISEDNSDATDKVPTTESDSLKPLNTCKKNYSSTSDLSKHKLSDFHMKNMFIETSGNSMATTEAAVANFSNTEVSKLNSNTIAEKIVFEEHRQDGSNIGLDLDSPIMFSDEVPLSVIAKQISNGKHRKKKQTKGVNSSRYSKKSTSKNIEKIREVFVNNKKRLNIFKTTLLHDKDFVISQVANKEYISSNNISDVHENGTPHQLEPSPEFNSMDSTSEITSKEKNEINSIEEITVLSHFVGRETISKDSDTYKQDSPTRVFEKLHQPLSLAILASKHIGKEILDSINRACVAQLNNLKDFRATNVNASSLPMEELKIHEESSDGHPKWQPSLKSIIALPSAFKELCFDSLLLREVEIQGGTLSEGFNTASSSLQDSKVDLLMPSNKYYDTKKQIEFSDKQKKNPPCEMQVPILLDALVQGPSLNAGKALESNGNIIEKITWPNILEIPTPDSCEEQNVSVQLPEDQQSLSLELDLEESLILQESSKSISDKGENVCPLRPTSPTPVYLESELQPSLLQETVCSRLTDEKHAQEETQKDEQTQLNFSQMYDKPSFSEQLEAEIILPKQHVTKETVVDAGTVKNLQSQDKIVLQKSVLEDNSCKLSVAENFAVNTPKVKKTKVHAPEKLQVQLPLLKIRDVQFLLAHHVDIQKTTYEDSDSQQSLPEGSDLKDTRDQQSSHVNSTLPKSVPNPVKSKVSLSNFPHVGLDLPLKNKGVNSSHDTNKLPSSVEYENPLHITYKIEPQVREKNSESCTHETDHTQQQTSLFDCSATLLASQNKISKDDFMSRIPVCPESLCNQVNNITNTLQLPIAEKIDSREYGKAMISLQHDELDVTVETCDHVTPEVLPQPCENTVSVPDGLSTQAQEYNMHLTIEKHNLVKQSESIKDIICQDHEIIMTAEEKTEQHSVKKGNAEFLISVPDEKTLTDKSQLKKVHNKVLSHSVQVSKTNENELWLNQNNPCKQLAVSQMPIQILENDTCWAQENECLSSDHLPREQITDSGPEMHESLCEPAFKTSSHQQFHASPTLNECEMPEHAVCILKGGMDASSDHRDPVSQVPEINPNIVWLHNSNTSEAVKENSSVEQHEIKYSSLHRLAEVVIWSENNSSRNLERAFSKQSELCASLEISDNVKWQHKIDPQTVLLGSSQHSDSEMLAPEDKMNWPHKEHNIIAYQNSSSKQSNIHSSLTKVSEDKLVWSQNNEICMPVLPEYSCENVSQTFKNSENSFTWSHDQGIHEPAPQNLPSAQHIHSPLLQISEATTTVSQEEENCLPVLQNLTSGQNQFHHQKLNISRNNVSWSQTIKPDDSLSQLRKSDIEQTSINVPNSDSAWSVEENISTTELQSVNVDKERINMIVTETELVQPQTSVAYTFPPPAEHNIHQASYPDPEFDVCVPHHPEVSRCAQQEYSFENVRVNPHQSSDTRSLQLHDQGSYISLRQSRSSEERTTVTDSNSVQPAFQESATNEFADQFSSLDDDGAQVSTSSRQEHALKTLPLDLLKAAEVELTLPQKPGVTAELMKEPPVLPLQEGARTKLLNSEMHAASTQDCDGRELDFQVGSTAWCGRESDNWPNEQAHNGAEWSGQSEQSSTHGWTEWVAGNVNWPQQAAPHFYSSGPVVPAGCSLGSIIDSVNQILNEGGTSVSSSPGADFGSYTAPPAGCVVPRGLRELQRAMGATDEEMLMLQKLGENCCWPLENADIVDLDGQKPAPERGAAAPEAKEADAAPAATSQPLQSVARKAAVSAGRRQRAEDRPFGQNILTQYESKEMVCPVCNKHFLGLTALQTHVTSAHNLDHAADRKAKASERSRQALISSIACSSLFQVNNSRHMCTSCKELHVNEESLRQHIEATHGGDVLTTGTTHSSDSQGSTDQKAEGLKSHMSSALGGLLNRALSSAFISRLSKEILARSEGDSSAHSLENAGTQQSQRTNVILEKPNLLFKGDTDDTKEKRFLCDLCDMKFYTLGSRNKHVQSVHLKMPINLTPSDVPDSAVSSTVGNSIEQLTGNNKEQHDTESGWDSESPPEWTAEPNMDGEILDGSFLCQDCGINFQTPQEVLSHQQLEHPPPESQSQNISDGSEELLASDTVSLVGDTDAGSNASENVADSGKGCADHMISSTKKSVSVEDEPSLATASSKLNSQKVGEKTVEKHLLSKCVGRTGEVTIKKVAKSKISIEELEKELCRNDAIIKAKAEAAIRELSLTRKGRSSAANTRWGVQRYKFVVPDRQSSSDKAKEKILMPADNRYNYPLIRKVSNSRFASLTERKKKLGSKSESLASNKAVGKMKLGKDIHEPDSTSLDVYEFEDDDSSTTKDISLRCATSSVTGKNDMQNDEQEMQVTNANESGSVVVSHPEQSKALLPCASSCKEKSDASVDKRNDEKQQEANQEILFSDKNISSEKSDLKESKHANQELENASAVKVSDNSVKLVCEESNKAKENQKYKGNLQKVDLDSKDTSSPAKNIAKRKKGNLSTNSKVGRKPKENDKGTESREFKPTKLQKKRKANESFELPPSKHAPQAESKQSETEEVVSLGRRQVKKVSYVELYDSEVDEQFLFYSDDEIGSGDREFKSKPKCKSPKKKQSKPDKKKRKSDQPVVQQDESCNSETVTHIHKKRCKQKLQSVDISSSSSISSCSSGGVAKSVDVGEACSIDSPAVESNKLQPKWSCASEPATDEDNTSESDRSDRQRTTKTDLLKTVFAKSRRSSTTIVSGSGGTIPEVDDSRTNTNPVKHKHKS
ncbi:uncharacterized protein LOC134531736 isoform X2 [Bacillus rossius redtenbacheri]|uniref:uncharacterized protein LOC134531736 isoform X2 n=1 Tax=Bacillus rossius redtenbacheri TaxID=93214 RepID=UPI002FDD0048